MLRRPPRRRPGDPDAGFPGFAARRALAVAGAPAVAPAAALTVALTVALVAGCSPAKTSDGLVGSSPIEGDGHSRSLSESGVAVADENGMFKERASDTGLDFVHFNGRSGQLYLAEITCGGGALLDADGDGDLDAYLAQGRMLGSETLDQASVPPRHPVPLTDRLYRNDLDGGGPRFTDVTAEAGLAAGGAAEASGYGCGVATGDFDNDGRVDLAVLNLGPDQLLRNTGDAGGRIAFRDVTATAAPALRVERSSVAASFFDYDRDGWLDLFVAHNVAFEYQDPPLCHDQTGAREYCGPGAFAFEPDQLLRNLGPDAEGTVRFADVTEAAGLAGSIGPALGVVTADFDGDGWPDIYVANDGEPNFLWISRRGADGAVTFTDEALLAGAGVNAGGEAEASMGVDAADVDGDGDLDLFMTHLIRETNTLYLNDGRGLFTDRTLGAGLGPESLAYTSFGTAFFDVDNDGWLDLLIVNGSVTRLPELVRRGDPFPLHQPNQLFRNLGGGDPAFVDATAAAGPALAHSEVSRGAAFGDVDNDGDADVLVINNGGPARLLVNQVGHRRHWLGLRLVGVPPRDVPGARAAVLRDGAPVVWRRVRTDGSYNSAHDPRLLFGLGDDPRVDGVRVAWPDGGVEEWAGVPAGRYTTLVQGTGRRVDG